MKFWRSILDMTNIRVRLSHSDGCIGLENLRNFICDKELPDAGTRSDADTPYLRPARVCRLRWPQGGGGVRRRRHHLSSDAGTLLLRHANRAIGLFDRVAGCVVDRRRPDLTVHSVRALVGQRIAAIALGYEDIDDHDTLRHDPVLALLSETLTPKRQDCAMLAGKSTLNRLELSVAGAPTRYHKVGYEGAAIAALFVDLFREAHGTPPREIVLDLDATDDPLHSQQREVLTYAL
jgi:hypothetical protein